LGYAWCKSLPLPIVVCVLRLLLRKSQGGGSTFGVITSATFKAFPSTPFNSLEISAATEPNTDTYWSAMAYLLSQFPSLSEQGISSYTSFAPNTTSSGAQIGALSGSFFLPSLFPSNTSASLAAALAPIVANINAAYPNQFSFSSNATAWPSFYDWWFANSGPNNAGYDLLFGSRLLDEQALIANVTALKDAIMGATAPGLGSGALLVSGKGVWNAVPRGGSNAVLPAWRKSLVHYSMSFTCDSLL
jgi:hypothetical protein